MTLAVGETLNTNTTTSCHDLNFLTGTYKGFNSILVSGDLLLSAGNLCNQFEPRS